MLGPNDPLNPDIPDPDADMSNPPPAEEADDDTDDEELPDDAL